MAVKSTEENGKLKLELDNGDMEKFKEVMTRYNFLDEQSLLRFAISIMLETKGTDLGILKEDGMYKVTPADSYLKK
jgi:hypothetical protein